MKGTQKRLVCPACGKVFFAWRPEELPGANVKCYFCGHQFADEAARRTPPPAKVEEKPAAAPVAAAPPEPKTPEPEAAPS
jgi:hypothetical protein